MAVLLALCTCPNSELAEKLAHALVEKRLAACVNRLPHVNSIYRWNGEICHDAEQLLLIKTTTDRFEALKACILKLHTHELPEVIAVNVSTGLDRYLAWVESETHP